MLRGWRFPLPLLFSFQLPNTESAAALFKANIKLQFLAMWESRPLIQMNVSWGVVKKTLLSTGFQE